MKDYTAPENRASFTPSSRATYSASAVDNVTHLCVLLAQLTAEPPRYYRAPVIRLIRVGSIAICSQIQSRTPYKSQIHNPCPVEEYHYLQNCFSVPVGGVVRMVRHSTHRVRDVWPRRGRQPHQTVHTLPVRPISLWLALLS